jgi:plasmid stabilization system protein ParE
MKIKLTEKEIQNLEEQFPYIAEASARQAYFDALSSGSSVLMVENSKLVEVFPDGSRKVIEKIAPHILVKKGTKFEIR